jgi:hypothetical protein
MKQARKKALPLSQRGSFVFDSILLCGANALASSDRQHQATSTASRDRTIILVERMQNSVVTASWVKVLLEGFSGSTHLSTVTGNSI